MSVWDERAQAEDMNSQDLNVMLSLAKGPKVDTIPYAQGPFGYSESNPIPVDDQLGQMEYLACLRCQCNEPFDFHRVGNVGIGLDGGSNFCPSVIMMLALQHWDGKGMTSFTRTLLTSFLR